jgi:hypothetical protein
MPPAVVNKPSQVCRARLAHELKASPTARLKPAPAGDAALPERTSSMREKPRVQRKCVFWRGGQEFSGVLLSYLRGDYTHFPFFINIILRNSIDFEIPPGIIPHQYEKMTNFLEENHIHPELEMKPKRSSRHSIILLAGMPRAGTAWCFETLTALTVACGHSDARHVRTKYGLEKYLTAGNTVIKLRLPDLLFILRPWWRGESFAVKTHDGPGTYPNRILSHQLLRSLLAKRIFIPIFMYRDPRDAVLSAYEYGQRQPETRGGAYFAKFIPTIEAGITWMERYLTRNWDAWQSQKELLEIRYEDLVIYYESHVYRMIEYLGLDLPAETISSIVEKFHRGENIKGTHFYKGVAGRFRTGFTPEQTELANKAFGPYLGKMGYEL